MKKIIITLAITVLCTMMAKAQTELDSHTLRDLVLRGTVTQVTQTSFEIEEKFGKLEIVGKSGPVIAYEFNNQGFVTKYKATDEITDEITYRRQSDNKNTKLLKNGESYCTIINEINSSGKVALQKVIGHQGEFIRALRSKYDSNGNKVEVINYNSDGNENSRIKVTNNADGYPIKLAAYTTTGTGPISDITIEYDDDNNMTAIAILAGDKKTTNNLDYLEFDSQGNWIRLLLLEKTNLPGFPSTSRILRVRQIVYADGTTTGYLPKA